MHALKPDADHIHSVCLGQWLSFLGNMNITTLDDQGVHCIARKLYYVQIVIR